MGHVMTRGISIWVAAAFIGACGGGGTGVSASNTGPTLTNMEAVSLLEGGTAVATLSASDAEGDALTFSIIGGEDEDAFSVTRRDGALSFLTAPDFESPGDVGTDNVYRVTVQVSDGSLSDSQTVVVTINNAFEGRVVDAPVSGASVFIDLNANNVPDAGEPAGTTDANGFFNVNTFDLPSGSVAKVVSKGGTDIITGRELPDLALISDIPEDLTKPANVTPLTTVLASVDTAEAKAALLKAMGITGTAESLLTTDGWKAASDGDVDAMEAQRVNQQLGVLLQTAATVAKSNGATTDVAVVLAKSVATQLSVAAVSEAGLDLASSAGLESILSQALTAALPSASFDAETVAAVAQSVATVNGVISDSSLDPLSDAASEILKMSQETLQASVTDVISGTVTVTQFNEKTKAADLLSSVLTTITIVDTDGDGVPNILDEDDDNDSVFDRFDAFPLNADESKDTDGDGIGDNEDDFIPGNFDEAFFDEFDWS
jgi:hypothetical protein